MAIGCPPPARIMRLLEEKRRLASDAYKVVPRRRKLVFDVAPVVAYAKSHLGRLQRIDLSLEPDEKAYRSLLETVPGLLACLHLHLYLEKRMMVNEVLVLEGSGGTGKSTLAYYLAKWLDGVMITPDDDVPRRLYELVSRRAWVPILVLDDIATVASKYWIWDRAERRRWMSFFKAIEFVRDVCGVLLMTARSFAGVAKKFRELATLVGTVKRVVVADEYAVDIIEWRKAGSSPLTAPVYLDVVWPGIRLPDEEFSRQLERRRELMMRYLESAMLEEGEENGGDDDA